MRVRAARSRCSRSTPPRMRLQMLGKGADKGGSSASMKLDGTARSRAQIAGRRRAGRPGDGHGQRQARAVRRPPDRAGGRRDAGAVRRELPARPRTALPVAASSRRPPAGRPAIDIGRAACGPTRQRRVRPGRTRARPGRACGAIEAARRARPVARAPSLKSSRLGSPGRLRRLARNLLGRNAT